MADDPKKVAPSPPPAGAPTTGEAAIGRTAATQPANPKGEAATAPTPSPTPAPATGDEAVVEGSNARRPAPGAPAIQTSKTDTPLKVKQRELEKQLREMSDDRSRRAAQGRAMVQQQLDDLARAEAQRTSGGNIRTPRGNLLMAAGLQDAHPDLHLRWVNENIPGRAELLRHLGYQRIGEAGGDTVLWGIPREQWAKNEIGKNEVTERNLRKATAGSRQELIDTMQRAFDEAGVRNVRAEDVVSRAHLADREE